MRAKRAVFCWIALGMGLMGCQAASEDFARRLRTPSKWQALQSHLERGLSRLADRWYLRQAREISAMPLLSVVLTRFDDLSDLAISQASLKELSRQCVSGRIQLHTAIDLSEEEIACQLDFLREEARIHSAEHEAATIVILARAQLSGSQGAYHLKVSWQDPVTLAPEGEVEERFSLDPSETGD